MTRTGILLGLGALMMTTANAAELSTTQGDDWVRTVVTDEDKAASSVYPTDDTKTGALLQCAGDSMSVYFAVEPIDFENLAERRTSRSRQWTGKLFIDGEMVDEREWVYLPALKAAWPGSKLVAAKVFNAIVRGQTVEFEVGNKGRVRVYLPSPDEAFSAFADDCKSYKEEA